MDIERTKKAYVTTLMKHILENHLVLAYAVTTDRFYPHGVIWFMLANTGTTGQTVADRWIMVFALDHNGKDWQSRSWCEWEGPAALSCPRAFLEAVQPPDSSWALRWRELVMKAETTYPEPRIRYTALHRNN